MYTKSEKTDSFPDFALPFEGRLDPKNRWVLLAHTLGWDEAEELYSACFPNRRGAPAFSVRMALGALLIKEICGYSDRETVEAITENPYLQYFLGLKAFTLEAPFHHSLMTTFRKRLPADLINKLNESAVLGKLKKKPAPPDEDPPSGGGPDSSTAPDGEPDSEPPPSGTLMIDATCAPADIRYPTDLGVIDDARELSERVIDSLRERMEPVPARPRTYREVCRKRFLEVAKMRRPKLSAVRKACRFLLNALERNLGYIDAYAEALDGRIPKSVSEQISVMKRVLEQQRHLLGSRNRSVPDRIVSVSQPHVRPIIRGKAGRPTEFGLKLSASLVDGYLFLDRLSWDAYNETGDLVDQCEAYRRRFGHYPATVLADKIYSSRANRKWCRDRGIRLSGPKLGRPPDAPDIDQLKLEARDSAERNAIEGGFGRLKRRYTLDRIMAKLDSTSKTVVAVAFLAANLMKIIGDISAFSRLISSLDFVHGRRCVAKHESQNPTASKRVDKSFPKHLTADVPENRKRRAA
jgi:hypothetical protein